MVFELADMNLESFMKGRGYLFEEVEIVSIFVKILKGLGTLHDRRISHGDIKLENIFVFKKKLGDLTIKIGDLGFSSNCDDDNLLTQFCGSPLYAAPEITLGVPYNPMRSDIWSIGVVLYALCSGRFPFDVDNDRDVMLLFNKIQNDRVDFDDVIVSDEGKNLMSLLLFKNPDDRPFANQIFDHPFVTKDDMVQM